MSNQFSVTNILGKCANDPKLEDIYLLDKQIGKGAFGVVRLSTIKSNGQKAAVKSIGKSKLMCKEDVKDVQSEVAIMNLVAGHPYTVTLKVLSFF
jgi:calcium-dependent protein kinase